ncbi:MAG: hypothetical protein Q9M91_07695 [Candidatus Dojkabacteria bacterium]|nr:hypothetical protein [Candidatus Dojkabacteria bacterium]MDQ7021669.1 hypothetical protein [Candidatus Dojkabacteria bacterium]
MATGTSLNLHEEIESYKIQLSTYDEKILEEWQRLDSARDAAWNANGEYILARMEKIRPEVERIQAEVNYAFNNSNPVDDSLELES